jgi:hypothetical protein
MSRTKIIYLFKVTQTTILSLFKSLFLSCSSKKVEGTRSLFIILQNVPRLANRKDLFVKVFIVFLEQ